MKTIPLTSDQTITAKRRARLILIPVLCTTLWLTAPLPTAGHEPARRQYNLTHLGDVPGKSQVIPYTRGLNNRGQVAGFGFNGFIVDEVAFVWDGGLTYLPTFPGAVLSRAQSLNDRGQVVGEIGFSASHRRATLWQGGIALDLGGLPEHEVNVAFGINNQGQIVGTSRKLTKPGPEPVLWSRGQVFPLPLLPNAALGFAFHINDRSQIIGFVGPDTANPRAVLWLSGTVTDLGTLGGTISRANTINNRGEIAGSASLANGLSHAALWNGGGILDLGTLGGTTSSASSLNDRGQVVGNARTAANQQHAFFWNDGVIVDLNDCVPANSGWVLQSGEGINDHGEIAGYGLYQGVTRAFLLTPVDDDEGAP